MAVLSTSKMQPQNLLHGKIFISVPTILTTSFKSYVNTTRTAIICSPNLYVHHTLFEKCSDPSGPSAIEFGSIGGGHALIEYSSFIDCVSKGSNVYGPCILVNLESNCVLNCVSSKRCYGTEETYGSFLCTDLRTEIINYIHLSSVSYSINEKHYSQGPLFLSLGCQKLTLLNIPYNKQSQYSAVASYIETPLIISLCNFNSNDSTEFTCLFIKGSTNSTISRSNIINNSQKLERFGTIYCTSDAKIENCCILNNKVPTDCLFFSLSCTITVINCTLPTKYTASAEKNGKIITPIFPKVKQFTCRRNPHIFKKEKPYVSLIY